MQVIPNPKSKLLAQSIVGGAGLTLPPQVTPPSGMALILLYVPLNEIAGKNPAQIQADLGIPWSLNHGQPYWFEENKTDGAT